MTIWSFAPIASAEAPKEFKQLEISIVASKALNATVARPDLLVHFHGAPETTERNFHEAGLPGVLVTVNCRGLSSAYRKPFENRKLFSFLISHAKQQLAADGQLLDRAQWGRITVSCFSAGYGAVRELLKDEDYSQRIDGVIAADSIYASIRHVGDKRFVDGSQMRPFVMFAHRAISEKQVLFLVSHSQLPVEPYASTVETADYLLSKTGLSRETLTAASDQAFAPHSMASRGGFTVLGFPGADAESHLMHLRNIASLWKKLGDNKD